MPAWLGSGESSLLDPSLHLLLVPSHVGKRVRELSGVLFIRVLILFSNYLIYLVALGLSCSMQDL